VREFESEQEEEVMQRVVLCGLKRIFKISNPETFQVSPEFQTILGEIHKEDCDAMGLAVMFHQIYERLALEFNYKTNPDTRLFDPSSPNGRLMIATCKELLRLIRDLKQGLDAGPGHVMRVAAQADVSAVEEGMSEMKMTAPGKDG
jgi:hypothetical protein